MKIVLLTILSLALLGCVTTYFEPRVVPPLSPEPVDNPGYLGTIEWGVAVKKIDKTPVQAATIVPLAPGSHIVTVEVRGAIGASVALWGTYETDLVIDPGKKYEIVALLNRAERTVRLFANVQDQASALECMTTHRVNFQYSAVNAESMKRCGDRKDTGYSEPEVRFPYMHAIPLEIRGIAVAG
ncbi:hypothetical protein [Solimonas sp. K1W22B-7]|uniref:hypothetical protein n=1 Tax=Solimonas sp. K1W22B-7 TaxID=2303331 RepID=UPI00196952B6|nr:hypothetical protein [Solimonas sp. K1W22B-7]